MLVRGVECYGYCKLLVVFLRMGIGDYIIFGSIMVMKGGFIYISLFECMKWKCERRKNDLKWKVYGQLIDIFPQL